MVIVLRVSDRDQGCKGPMEYYKLYSSSVHTSILVNPFSAGIDFRRQNIDHHTERGEIPAIPALKEYFF